MKVRLGLRRFGVHPLIYVQRLEAFLFPIFQPVEFGKDDDYGY